MMEFLHWAILILAGGFAVLSIIAFGKYTKDRASSTAPYAAVAIIAIEVYATIAAYNNIFN